MKIITYATHRAGYIDALEESAQRNGFELVILGKNKSWEGFTQKINDMDDYLSTLEATPDEIVCFVDGFDCIVLGTSQEMLEKYRAMQTDKVVFGSEGRRNPLSVYMFGEVKEEDKHHEFRALNSGCYIGPVHKIRELLKNICAYESCQNSSNDQEITNSYYLKCVDCLKLDHEATLFYNHELTISNIYYFNPFKFNFTVGLDNPNYEFTREGKHSRLIVKKTRQTPVIFHAVGNTNIDAIVDYLELPPGRHEEKKYFDYSIKVLTLKLVEQCPWLTNVPYVLWVIVLLVLIVVYRYATVNKMQQQQRKQKRR